MSKRQDTPEWSSRSDHEIASTPDAQDRRHVDDVRTASHGAAYDVCKNLISELDPQYRRRYFSQEITLDMRERTTLMQKLVLSMLRRGPVRECIEERAERRAFRKTDEPSKSGSEDEKESGDVSAGKMNPFLREVCDLFATANDDNAFAFLCLLFDKDVEERFDMVAGAFMEMFQFGDPNLSSIMQDVALHAQWKCFGIKNLREHQKRESSLICVSDVVGKARAAYGLAPYSEIQMDFR